MDYESALTSLLEKIDADYAEVRIEDSKSTGIVFLGKGLDAVTSKQSFGAAVRVLKNGGWGFATLNDFDKLEHALEIALRSAELVGRSTNDPATLADAPTVKDSVVLDIGEDPREISLAGKIDLLGKYHERFLGFGGLVSSASVRYNEKFTTLFFANTEGSSIRQEKLDIAGHLIAIAQKNGVTQTSTWGYGGNSDFGVVRGLENRIDERCEVATALAKSEPVRGGTYTVVIDPYLAGVFIHEAFGHLSEADHIAKDRKLADIMVPGKKLGSDILNVYDSGLEHGLRGSLKYDDEGVRTRKTWLLQEGELVSRLHSRETAKRMNEEPTGSARAITYQFPPIPRMRNTCIVPGKAKFDDLIGEVDNGIYAVGAAGGMTNGEQFTFTAGEAYMIREGRIEEPVREVTLSGNVFSTMKNIDGLSDAFDNRDSGGGCGKAGQFPLPVSHGGPHVRIRGVVVGGT
ncbi:MAG: TldD/PmbA family protein [Planctomycetes bacterium]|nr:TldD/PmbA family protein [Planctomycetota bacterium]